MTSGDPWSDKSLIKKNIYFVIFLMFFQVIDVFK